MMGLNLEFPLLLSTVIDHAAACFGATEIVCCSPGATVRTTYRQMAERSRRLASGLRRLALGSPPGSAQGSPLEGPPGSDGFVGSLAWNTHRHLELFYGVSGAGLALHTANPRLPPEQIIYAINFTGYRTLFIDLDTVGLAEQIAPRLETVDRYVVMASRRDMPATGLPNLLCYEDVIEVGDPAYLWPALDERSACALCFTSGTTGQPKGVLYSHRGTVLSALSTGGGNGWALSAGDAILAVPGFFHCNGWAVPFLGPMYGAKLVLPGRRADAAWLHGLILNEEVSITGGVPTVWLGLLEHCRETGQGLGRLRCIYSGGSAPPASMIESFGRDHGVSMRHGWGMTETTHGSTISCAAPGATLQQAVAAVRAQGKPAYGNEIRTVDDDGAPLPRDGHTPGHLQVRGHWIAGGYFRRPDAELQTEDGWMRTGDVAVIDPDNTLHIVDRAKDVIKSGGEWISSQTLEEAAARHPCVQEAAVVAMAHPKWQERPFLILVARDRIPLEDLRSHLLQHVPKWWLPDAVAFVDTLPHGPTGKLHKETLRRQVASGAIVPESLS